MIQLFRPTLGEEELAAVGAVFESGWLGRGPRTDEFEQAFAEHLGVDPAQVLTITDCTEGLFVAMELFDIGPGDEVVLPTVSFVGAANAVAATGATPVFCDVDTRTLNPRADQVERALTARTRAVLPLHYGGYPGEIEPIAELCRERGIHLLEDAACSVSSRVGGRALGTLGDFGAWSFDAMKILVTGDGGMVYVRDPDRAERLKRLTYLGLEAASGFSRAASADRWWEFEISSFSRRSIVNDITSAIGLVQLARLPEFIARRRAVHDRYTRELAAVDWLELPPEPAPGVELSYYFYWLQLATEELRDGLALYLRDRGIYTTFRYYPLHRVERYGFSGSLPEADDAAARTLCIPIHQALTDEETSQVIEAVAEFGAAQPSARGVGSAGSL